MTQSSPTELGFLPASTFWQAGHVCGEHVLPYPCTAPLIVYAWGGGWGVQLLISSAFPPKQPLLLL